MTFEEFILQQFDRYTFKTEEQIEIDYFNKELMKPLDIYRECYLYKQISDLEQLAYKKKLMELTQFITENYFSLLTEFDRLNNNK